MRARPKILYLAPVEAPDQRQELEAINKVLERLDGDRRPEVESRFGVQAEELLALLADKRLLIVHIATHGSESGVEFAVPNGSRAPRPEALAKVFAERRVPCVLLSACNSRSQAEAISPYATVTIGFDGELDGDCATKFFEAWYRAAFMPPQLLALAFAEGEAALGLGDETADVRPCSFPESSSLRRLSIDDLLASLGRRAALEVLGIFAGVRGVDNLAVAQLGRELFSIKQGLQQHEAANLVEAIEPSIEELYATIFEHRPQIIHLHAMATETGHELVLGDPATSPPPIVLDDLFRLVAHASGGSAECMLLWSRVDTARVDKRRLPAKHVIVLGRESVDFEREAFVTKFYDVRGRTADSRAAFEEASTYISGADAHECLTGRPLRGRSQQPKPIVSVQYFLLQPPQRAAQLDYAEEVLRARRVARLVGPTLELAFEWNVSPKQLDHHLRTARASSAAGPKIIVISGVCDGVGFDTRSNEVSGVPLIDHRYLNACIKAANLESCCFILVSSNTSELAEQLSRTPHAETSCVGFKSPDVQPAELTAYVEGFLLGYGTGGDLYCAHQLGRLFTRIKNPGSESNPRLYPDPESA